MVESQEKYPRLKFTPIKKTLYYEIGDNKDIREFSNEILKQIEKGCTSIYFSVDFDDIILSFCTEEIETDEEYNDRIQRIKQKELEKELEEKALYLKLKEKFEE